MLERWKRWLTENLTLPEDVLMDTPRVTMIGQHHLHVENHRGVLFFSKESIRLKLTEGELLIKGEQFTIKKIYAEELLIEGIVQEITYPGEKQRRLE